MIEYFFVIISTSLDKTLSILIFNIEKSYVLISWDFSKIGNRFDKLTLMFFPETKPACQYFWSRWQCTTWTNSLKYGVTMYGRNHWKVLNGLVEKSAISHQYSLPVKNIFSILRHKRTNPVWPGGTGGDSAGSADVSVPEPAGGQPLHRRQRPLLRGRRLRPQGIGRRGEH